MGSLSLSFSLLLLPDLYTGSGKKGRLSMHNINIFTEKELCRKIDDMPVDGGVD